MPSPSKNGEVWVFNKDYTQYIPLSLQDAQACLGVPVMWVFDCNRAGLAVRWYKEFLTQRRGGVVPPEEMFLLGACGADEYVPLSPEYPADVFTACLTTPVRMAALWYVRHAAMRRFDPALAAQIPGDVTKRNTPLGELAWIYTTITDTIAYDILPYDLFQLLLRHDLTVATLFRNFLLAQRIMRSLGCTPVSVPTIPENYKHPLWAVLDSEIDACLSQFAVSSSSSYSSSNVSSSAAAVAAVGLRTNNGSSDSSSGFTEAALAVGVREYVPSNFFMEQLQGFDVWLGFGADNPRAPEQLPAILQMALSQRHRARALKLLSRFVDIGPAAVMQTLHIGAFTYLVRFLETATDDIRAHLTLIWTKILVFDRRYQREIARDRRYQKDLSRDRDNTGDRFFLDTLFNQANSEPVRAMAAFVLSAIMDEYPAGQSLCSDDHFISYTLGLLNQYARTRPRPLFGTVFYWWVVLALAKIWENNDVTKYKAIRSKVSKYLPPFLEHSAPEVRAATLYAYGTFFSDVPNNYKPEVQKLIKDDEVFFATNAGLGANDGSLLVRREYVFALSRFLSGNIAEAAHVVRELEQYSALTSQSLLSAPAAATATAATAGTVVVGGEAADEPSSITPNAAPLPTKGPITMGLKALAQQPRRPLQEDSGFSFYSYVWKTLLDLTDDPQPEVADIATDLVQRVRRFVASRTNGVVNVSADGSQEDPKVALRSTFYEWSTEYWKLPLIGRDFEDTTSPEYTEREKRHKAYNAMYASSRDAWADWEQGTRRDMGLQATLQGQKDEVTTRMIFHPYEKTLVCATGSENIVVWDWAAQKRLKTFPNKSRLSTRITSFLFSNEYDDTHLIVGSDDGTVKVWKDYAAPDVPPKMAASWVAIPDSRQLDYEYKGGSDVVMEWLGTDNIVTNTHTIYTIFIILILFACVIFCF